ncbi:hypothetical protein FB451DRAFT_1393142 [Mycena latifolia]|nr:hypothetical protein FB451DRAFT_1393142 [Mycena latifolia]
MTETGEWTDDEVEALVATYQGDAAVQELRTLRSYTSDGPWRANSMAGYGSRYCRDIRVAPLNHNFSIVYWGGEGAEVVGIWSFHIARFRPNATQFDERYDGHLTLANENLRVLVEA